MEGKIPFVEYVLHELEGDNISGRAFYKHWFWGTTRGAIFHEDFTLLIEKPKEVSLSRIVRDSRFKIDLTDGDVDRLFKAHFNIKGVNSKHSDAYDVPYIFMVRKKHVPRFIMR